MTHPSRHSSSVPGIAMLISAMACFAVSDVLAKYLSGRIPAGELAWFRYLGLVITLLPLVRAAKGTLRSAVPRVQYVRAICLAAASIFFIVALRTMPIAETTALAFASPLFVTLLSAIALRERVDHVRWTIVTVGFCGVLIVMRPGTAAFHPMAMLPVASSMAWAVAVVCTRKASVRDSIATTMLYSAVIGFAILCVFALSEFVVPTPQDALVVVAMAALWSGAQWLTVAAFGRGDASTLAPFAYSQLFWATMLGYIVFGHVPDAWSFIGIAVILCSGMLAAYRATRRGGAYAEHP